MQSQFWAMVTTYQVFGITLSAAACFGWFLVARLGTRLDHETRCRKCAHILKGLSEPRCPECGERI